MTVSSPCSASFELFEAEIRWMYGNKDCRLNAAIKAAGEYQQGEDDPNETVRSNANRIRTNWRDAGWDEATNAAILYDYAWSGLLLHLWHRGGWRSYVTAHCPTTVHRMVHCL